MMAPHFVDKELTLVLVNARPNMKNFRSRTVACLCLIAVIFVAGCSLIAKNGVAQTGTAPAAEEQISIALSRYRELIVRMEPAAVASAFTEQGAVSHGDQAPVVGREAIRAFMATFSSYKIIEYELKVTSAQVGSNAATQTGTYRQVVTVPAGQTVTVQGTFVAEWELQFGNHWLLRSMHTESAVAG